jgi:hypothetical protein
MNIKEQIKSNLLLEAVVKYVVKLEDDKYYNIVKKGNFDLIKKVSSIKEAKFFDSKEDADNIAKDFNGKVVEIKRR